VPAALCSPGFLALALGPRAARAQTRTIGSRRGEAPARPLIDRLFTESGDGVSIRHGPYRM